MQHRHVLGLISGLVILALLAVPILTGRSDAQTADAPAWWRLLSVQLQCTDVNPTLKRCIDPRPSVRNDTAYFGEGVVLLSIKDSENPGDARKQVSAGIEFVPDFNGELVYDRSNASAHRLAGFGVTSYTSADCPAAAAVMTDILSVAGIPRSPAVTVEKCTWNLKLSPSNKWITSIVISSMVELKPAAPAPTACNTNLLEGIWRAESPALATTGHTVTFAAAVNVPAHDGGQRAQRGLFAVYPAHKNKLALLPNPLFTAARGYDVGNGLCLIPVVSQRDSGTSRSAVLLQVATTKLRFMTENAYRWTGKTFRLEPPSPDKQVIGIEGIWSRGTVPALAKTCTPADFNGRWDRSDGARITIRGTGSDGIGGTASMDENPGNWVRGQSKYTNIRIKDACTYTAKCYASQRTRTNGRPDFRMIESACELRFDPVRRTLREIGTGNTYVYTKPGDTGPASSNPPPPSRPEPSPAPPPPPAPVETIAAGSLNAEQARAARRDIEAYEARKKAVADQQAASQRAYDQALADHQAKLAALARQAEEDQARWRAAVAACKAGDRSQCAPQR